MRRPDIINRLASAINAREYLEIGVEAGNTFREVSISHKRGVDPDLKADPATLGGEFCGITSDGFFFSPEWAAERYDIVFVDGLHTFEQSLRDLINSLDRLHEGGVVILDDVRPSDPLAALRDHGRCRALKEQIGSPDRNWMGDVFKTVVFLNDFLLSCEFRTIDLPETSLCVVWKTSMPMSRPSVFNDLSRISSMDYIDVLERPEMFRATNLDQILSAIMIARDSRELVG